MRRPSAKEIAAWDARLAESGFRDIEPVPGGSLSGGSAGIRTEEGRLEEGLEYRLHCEAFQREYKFATRFERRVWSQHMDGMTLNESARALGTYRRKVHETLQRLQSACQGWSVCGNSGKPKRKVKECLRTMRAKEFFEVSPMLAMEMLARSARKP